MIGLDQTATVLTPDPTTGAWTVAATTGLACRLALLSADTTRAAPERTELESTRRLLWDPAVTIPETAHVLVEGVEWVVVPGTLAAVRGSNSSVVYRRADVTRAGD